MIGKFDSRVASRPAAGTKITTANEAIKKEGTEDPTRKVIFVWETIADDG